MQNPSPIPDLATRLLEMEPDPLVQYRLRRDVLQQPPTELLPLKSQLDANPWVGQLINEQHPDGGWGRFHSRDSQSKQKILTTEFGVARGLALGLDARHPCMQKTIIYLAGVLRNEIKFPDPPECNDRWQTGIQLFTAAMLARLDPAHPLLDDPWLLWAEIAARTFMDGDYDPAAEIQAHRQLTGATIKDSYLVLNNKYALALLSARIADLEPVLGTRILEWVWSNPQGVRYLGVTPSRLPIGASPTTLELWFTSYELLARFPGWRDLGGEVVDWLWSQQGDDGLWDFGRRSAGSHYFPLSPNWRKPIQRKIDWSNRVLVLLAQYY
jgi:hypothetical protein